MIPALQPGLELTASRFLFSFKEYANQIQAKMNNGINDVVPETNDTTRNNNNNIAE
jgi:hypothetical protein